MRRSSLIVSALVVIGLALAGCGDVEEPSGGTGGGSSLAAGDDTVCATTEAAEDLLAQICSRGVLTVSTDPAYPPQSKYVPKKGVYDGFDIDVATEIAERVGVEIAWEAPEWDVITFGGWNGRWDMSVGSMTPTNDRQEVLAFTEPYYFTPAVALVNESNTTVADLSSDLDGQSVEVCSGCTYEQFLDKSLDIAGFEFDVVLPQAFRVIIPPTGNEFIAMMKDTALVSFLGVTAASAEMFRRSQLVGKADFKNLEAYVLVAGFYWALTVPFTLFQNRLEKRLATGYVRDAVPVRRATGRGGFCAACTSSRTPPRARSRLPGSGSAAVIGPAASGNRSVRSGYGSEWCFSRSTSSRT